MAKVTRSEVYGAFRQFCKEIDHPCRDDIPESEQTMKNTAGSLYLEYVPKEGYRIQQVGYAVEDGAEMIHTPFSLDCRPAKEMFDTIRFAVQLLVFINLKERARKQTDAVKNAMRKVREKEGRKTILPPGFFERS